MAWPKRGNHKNKNRKPKSSKLYEDSMRPKEPVYERASWTQIAQLAAYVLVMGGIGVGVAWAGHLLLGVVFVIVAVLPPALVGLLAAKGLPQALGPRRKDCSAEEFGDYLGWGGTELVRTLSRGLSQQELDVLEWNRAAEAAATHDWFVSLPGNPGFEDVRVTSDDGTELAGHVLELNPGSNRWVVYVHGLDGNWRSGLTFARRLAEQGVNFLFVELRAHGASGGRWVGAGWLDRRDVVAWCRWLAGRAGEGARIVLFGQSMGAASVLMASGEDDLPSQVVACVSDSAYTDFWNVAIHVLSTYTTRWGSAAHPLLDVARLALRLSPGGYDIARARPVDAIARSRVPVALVHGEDDPMVPSHMARTLRKAAGGAAAGEGCKLVVIPSAGHCVSVFADPEAYYGGILPFVGRYL